MRKVLKLIAVGLSAMMLVGCSGGKEQSVTLKMEQEGTGVTVEMKLDAKGDTVHTMTQTSTIDLGELGEEYAELMQEEIDKAESKFEAIDGATYSYSTEGGKISETITIDMTDSASLDTLSSERLLPIEGTTSKISLKKTQETLESQGWAVQ